MAMDNKCRASTDEILRAASTVFWDFDGVIKDSVEVKTRAFVKLFQPFGPMVVERVRKHHEAHGGMSRFDKLPLYLQWAGRGANPSRVSEFGNQFGELVLQGVIEAPWVPGVESYLRSNTHQQTFALISATPQDELEQILYALDLKGCFAAVFGAPNRKKDAIRTTLAARGLAPNDCLMIGDARADLEAAEANQVPFMLRWHETNLNVFADYTGPSFKDFTAL
jgi:phosphoglycolate phosphatase-like HAD superfamily hydrolase